MIDMNTPDWKDAPEWANWLAQDKYGAWWWHEKKPARSVDEWRVKSIGLVSDAEFSYPKWGESLQKRPTA